MISAVQALHSRGSILKKVPLSRERVTGSNFVLNHCFPRYLQSIPLTLVRQREEEKICALPDSPAVQEAKQWGQLESTSLPVRYLPFGAAGQANESLLFVLEPNYYVGSGL